MMKMEQEREKIVEELGKLRDRMWEIRDLGLMREHFEDISRLIRDMRREMEQMSPQDKEKIIDNLNLSCIWKPSFSWWFLNKPATPLPLEHLV